MPVPLPAIPPSGCTSLAEVKVEVVIRSGRIGQVRHPDRREPVFEKGAADAVRPGRFEPAQTETKAAIVLDFEDR